MRRPHYLKANNSEEYPRHCVWVDTETKEKQVDKYLKTHHLNFGYACYRRRSRGHKWSKPQWFRYTDLNEFWTWLTDHIGPKECYTMFAHNWSFDFPVLDGFNWLLDNGWTLRSAVIESPPIILKWCKDGRTIKVIDTLNIWRTSLAILGASIGKPKLPFPGEKASQEEWDTYGQNDVVIIMEAMIKWFDFIREHELGGFAPTLASQAMRAYRHRFMHHKILIDDNEDALSMARAAYHGGRTECFHVGEFDGPLYQLDINSMYPKVMHGSMMPTKLLGVYRRVSHLELGKLLKDFSVIAEVTLDIDKPIFPQYTDGKLLFPIGKFATTLTTPEIQYALDHGYIVNVDRVAVYNQAVIFKEYIDYFYALRLKHRASGDMVDEALDKLFLTNLYGKFGQRGRMYETVDQVEDRTIETWAEVDADTGQTFHYRKFAGQVQYLKEEVEGRDSHPAIAAHVTAFARMMMWEIYNTAGIVNCYYSDTDCVVVNQVGFDALQGMIDPSKLGMLKLEKVIKHATIHGPKDYAFDDLFRLKGVKTNALWLDRNTIEQEQWAGLKGLIARGDLTAPTTRTIIKHLKREYGKGIVLPGGRVVPYRVG